MHRGLSAAVLWVALVAFLTFLFRIGKSGDAPFALMLASAIVLATLVVGFLRARGADARLQEYLASGEAERVLALVDRRLRYVRRADRAAPYRLIRGSALSMLGRWQEALDEFDRVDPAGLPQRPKGAWQLSLASGRFHCLLLLERVDEARALFAAEVEPAENEGEGAKASVESCRAQLEFCTGERMRSLNRFRELLSDPRYPPAARALFHYFIGRIQHDLGQVVKAKEAFERARDLGARTWIPAGIDAVVSGGAGDVDGGEGGKASGSEEAESVR